MRLFFAAFVAICALSPPAVAQPPDCKSIAGSGARLACYDKAAPAAKPAVAARPLASVSAPSSKSDTGKYVDTISAEDALMNARLRNICRGC